MPTYQYACRSCDHRFESVQGFHEKTLTTCPACNEEGLRKLFGNVGVVFKGSGFYRTDSRAAAGSKGSRPAGPKSDSDSSSTPSATSSADSSASSDSAKSTQTAKSGTAAQPASA